MIRSSMNHSQAKDILRVALLAGPAVCVICAAGGWGRASRAPDHFPRFSVGPHKTRLGGCHGHLRAALCQEFPNEDWLKILDVLLGWRISHQVRQFRQWKSP